MRRVGSETAELLEGLFKPRKKVVKYPRQVAEFVVDLPDRQAFIQALGCNLLGAESHLLQRG